MISGAMKIRPDRRRSDADEAPSTSRRQAFMTNALLGLVAAAVLFWLWPEIFHTIVFEWMLTNWGRVLPFAGVLGLALLMRDELMVAQRRAVVLTGTAFLVAVALNILFLTIIGYFTAISYTNFTERQALLTTPSGATRFTPLENAYVDMKGVIGDAAEDLELQYTYPVFTERGLSYMTQITPDGLYNLWFGDDPGFVAYDDGPMLTNRVRRVDVPFTVGYRLQWFDDIDRNLVLTDFFATYDAPHYVHLGGTEAGEIVLVAPKTKYFLWLLPYWGGVTLIHADGSVEDLSAEEATGDARLKGQWIYPISLALEYVELQNYKTSMGYIGRFMRVEDRLSVPELEGENQFPFLTKGADGQIYLVTATIPKGSGGGMYAMYYVNASTGEQTRFRFNDRVVYHPNAALARVQNIEGFNWYRKSGDSASGNHIAIEPVYVVRESDPDHLYWKFTITNKDHAGMAGTAIADAQNLSGPPLVFRERAEFEDWLHGSMIVPAAATTQASDPVAELKALLLRAGELLEKIGQTPH